MVNTKPGHPVGSGYIGMIKKPITNNHRCNIYRYDGEQGTRVIRFFLGHCLGLLDSWKLDMSNEDLVGCFVLSVIVIFDWAWLEDKKQTNRIKCLLFHTSVGCCNEARTTSLHIEILCAKEQRMSVNGRTVKVSFLLCLMTL